MQGLRFFSKKNVPMILQSENAECGLACLAMVSAYFGKHIDLMILRNEFRVSAQGLSVKHILEYSANLELNGRALKVDLDSINELSLPAILHWDFKHFVVLEKVKRNTVSIVDPSQGRKQLNLVELGEHFTGIAIELTPNSQFERGEFRQKLKLWPLLKSVKGLKKSFANILILALALQIFTLLTPIFMQLVLDHAVVSYDKSLLIVLATGFFMLGLFQVVVGLIRSWLILILGTSLDLELQKTLFSHLLSLPLGFFEKRHTGDIMSRFDSLNHVQRMLSTHFIESIVDGVLVLSTLALMFIYSVKLTLIVVVAALVYGIARLLWYKPLQSATQEQIVWGAKQQSHFIESLRSVQSLKLANAEAERKNHYNNLMVEEFNSGIDVEKLNISFRTLNGLLFTIENISVIAVGGFAVISGSISIGMLVAFIAFKRQFITRISTLIDRLVDLKMLGLHLGRIADIALEQRESTDGQKVNPTLNCLSAHDLSFRYSPSSPFLLKSINLQISSGESIAITGSSGVGKSTLIKVLLKLIPATSGEIFWNNIALSSIDKKQYRTLCSAVLQDDQLIAGSVKDNIIFSAHEQGSSWMKECARIAAIDQEIEAMPMGYNTLIGDMGTCLSSGQKQRILLARALYRRPQILFLDEATSHLDVENERRVNSELAKLNIARVIVAHRPKTIANADRVLVLGLDGLHEINKLTHLPTDLDRAVDVDNCALSR